MLLPPLLLMRSALMEVTFTSQVTPPSLPVSTLNPTLLPQRLDSFNGFHPNQRFHKQSQGPARALFCVFHLKRSIFLIFDTHENCQKRILDHQQEKMDLSLRQLLEKYELGEQFLETDNSPASPRANQAGPGDAADHTRKPLGIRQVWPQLPAPA